MTTQYLKLKFLSIPNRSLVVIILLIFSVSFFTFVNSVIHAKKSFKKEYKVYGGKQNQWKSKRVNQFVNTINYTATQVPLNYYLTKNIVGPPQMIDSILTSNNKERIIEIEFEHMDQKDLLLQKFTNKEYQESVAYLGFTIAKDFTIVTSSNRVIKCLGVQFERNFKVAPFKRVLLYFNDIPPNDTFQLIYQDELFGNGTIKFNFNETPLKL